MEANFAEWSEAAPCVSSGISQIGSGMVLVFYQCLTPSQPPHTGTLGLHDMVLSELQLLCWHRNECHAWDPQYFGNVG